MAVLVISVLYLLGPPNADAGNRQIGNKCDAMLPDVIKRFSFPSEGQSNTWK